MNKATKTVLNYTIGIVITILLLGQLYFQVKEKQLVFNWENWHPTTHYFSLFLAIIILPINLMLEGVKWKWLVNRVFPISFKNALISVMIGISFSLITPNRIGEYPGRIWMIKERKATRFISISILGVLAQMLTVMLFGTMAFVFYIRQHPLSYYPILALMAVLGTLIIALFYFSFEKWAPVIEKIKWLKKINLYAYLLKKFTFHEQLKILLISLLRFAFLCIQYYHLLYWLGLNFSFFEGFYLAALFFWVMAVVPSIVLTELGIRAQVALFLFSSFTPNATPILIGVLVLWIYNLMFPALTGAALLFRKKLLS